VPSFSFCENFYKIRKQKKFFENSFGEAFREMVALPTTLSGKSNLRCLNLKQKKSKTKVCLFIFRFIFASLVLLVFF
jgi:hypothetical protein